MRSVDRKAVGAGKPGPITRTLQDAFFGLFDGRTADRWGWLETVDAPATATHDRASHSQPASLEISA